MSIFLTRIPLLIEGLLLLCKSNVYLIDNFFQQADGEVVEIWDVPKSVAITSPFYMCLKWFRWLTQLRNRNVINICNFWKQTLAMKLDPSPTHLATNTNAANGTPITFTRFAVVWIRDSIEAIL